MNNHLMCCCDQPKRTVGGRLSIGGLSALLCCLLLVTGCQSGFSGKSWFTWKNPFASTKSTEQTKKTTPSSKTVAKKDAKKKGDERTLDFAEEMIRARGLEKSGKYSEAREIYQRLIISFPDHYEPYHRLGVVADYQKRYREAQGLFEEAIRLERNNPQLFNDLGYCFFLQGRLDKAERSLLTAVSMAPSNEKYRNNLGMVYGHQGRYQDALEQFRRAGSEADAQYNLAFVKASRNDFDGAEECFHLSLAADPTYEPARRALASFHKTRSDPLGKFDNSPVVENGTYWVPYREDGGTGDSNAQTVAHHSPVGEAAYTQSGETNRSLRTTAQSQLRRARMDAAVRVQQGYSE